MVKIILTFIGTLALACTEKKDDRVAHGPTKYSSKNSTLSDNTNSSTKPNFKGITVEGIPSGQNEDESFALHIKASAEITFFSVKLGTEEDCAKGEGYKVYPIAEKPTLTLTEAPAGPRALCMIAYHGPSKTWQTVKDAQIFTWEKIDFVRELKTEYQEYVEACNKNIVTKATVSIKGKLGTYAWVTDYRSQGCELDTETGTDSLKVELNDKGGIKGFWSFVGGEASGWYKFYWSNPERTKSTGSFGYGDPGQEPAGEWNSVE